MPDPGWPVLHYAAKTFPEMVTLCGKTRVPVAGEFKFVECPECRRLLGMKPLETKG